jgi:hypothetical protein
MLRVIILFRHSATRCLYSEYRNAECHDTESHYALSRYAGCFYAEYHNAECHYAWSHCACVIKQGDLMLNMVMLSVSCCESLCFVSLSWVS